MSDQIAKTGEPTAASRNPTPGPPTGTQAENRKYDLFAHTSPALIGSIADAVAIKRQDVFLLTRPDGSIPPSNNYGLGLYFRDCRFLDGWEMRVNRQTLYAVVATADTGFSAIFEFTNSVLFNGAQSGAIPSEGLGIRWQVAISGEPIVHNLLTISNFTREVAKLSLDLAFSTHFDDIFNIRGYLEDHPGESLRSNLDSTSAEFRYQGGDGRLRTTRLAFLPAPTRLTSHGPDRIEVHYELSVPPRDHLQLAYVIQVNDAEIGSKRIIDPQPASEHKRMQTILEQSASDWLKRDTSIATDNMLFDRALERSLLDLHMLQMELQGYEYFAAGLPWFGTLFGRDSLISAYQMLAFNPSIAEQTLRLLASYQGKAVNAWRDEEPGRILHELRVGELTHLNYIPMSPYYGTVDSTPLFLILLGSHARWTGSLTLFEDLRPNVEAALDWIDEYGDLSSNGYLEYSSIRRGELINQGWKDSGNAVMNADGSICTPPIALVEVQGYVYLARLLVADLYERAGDTAQASLLREKARALFKQFNADFWQDDLGFYALALQKDKRPARVRTSNPGQALWTGIVAPEHADAVVDTLMKPEMFSGWGIRTLARDEVTYNPVGYHVGGVWPHDCSLIAAGFRRVGRDSEALTLFTGLFEAATKFPGYRLPELFSGFSQTDYRVPVRYPTACHPQAWGAGTLPFFLLLSLGIEPNAWDHQLRLVRPRLPTWIRWAELHGLRVGDATVDLRFEQMGVGSAVAVLKREGRLAVEVVE